MVGAVLQLPEVVLADGFDQEEHLGPCLLEVLEHWRHHDNVLSLPADPIDALLLEFDALGVLVEGREFL
jgi:hypothetical protein